MENNSHWIEILAESQRTMDCLLTKLWAVDLVSNSNGCETSGIDGISFFMVPRNIKSKSVALKYLYDCIKKLKYDISLSEGATNQAIQRKGIKNLNSREMYRRYLKSKEGKIYIKKCKHLYQHIKNNPITHASNLRSEALENNFKLKFKLLESLKPFKIKKYSADPIVRVFIPKSNGRFIPLGIPTLKDRTMQTYLKLAMEPYMEPLGDRNSFGFRPGRNCHQAISYLSNRLMVKTSHAKKKPISLRKRNKQSALNGFYQKAKNTDKKMYYVPYHLLHADIERCFDKISHDWLISNVPIPSKYEFLLKQVLKADIVENNNVVQKKIDNKCGVPQGGILSPLLMNWTLDGIENLIFETVADIKSEGSKGPVAYYDLDKYTYYKKKELNNLRSEFEYRQLAIINLKTTSWMVRYADDFIIGVKGEMPLNKVKNRLELFLKKRGLALSKEKTETKIFNRNAKLNFLSWTFHYLVPKRVSWIIKKNKRIAGRLSDWAGLYVYPSKKAVSKLKKKIKQITSNVNSWKNENIIIKAIAKLVSGWSNYFSPAPGQGRLRSAIDWYIFKRMKRYLFKKYGSSYVAHYLRLNQNADGSRKKSIGFKSIQHGRESSLSIPRLYKLNAPCMWSEVVPEISLLNSSFLYDQKPYIKRAIKIIGFREGLHHKLFKKQKGTCPLCHQQLINWEEYLLQIGHESLSEKHEKANSSLTEISLFKYYSQINSAAVIPNNYVYNPNNVSDFSSKSLNEIVTLKKVPNFQSTYNYKWHKNIDLDHIIPIKLAGNIESLMTLVKSIDNSRLVHKDCHKKKTFGEEEQRLFKNYRKTRKSLVPVGKKLKTLDKNEVEKLHIETLLELEKDGKLEYLSKNNTIREHLKKFLQLKT